MLCSTRLLRVKFKRLVVKQEQKRGSPGHISCLDVNPVPAPGASTTDAVSEVRPTQPARSRPQHRTEMLVPAWAFAVT